MRYLLVISIIFCTLTTTGQKSIHIGQGILNIDFETLPTIQFYTDTNQTTPTRTVSITKDKQGEFILKNSSQITSWLKPEGLWLDYGIFIIRVDTVIGKWYRVFTDNDKGILLWTKANNIKKFIKWQTFLVNETTAISKLKEYDLEIKKSPSENSATIKKIENGDCFEAIEIKGDWLHIKTNEVLDCNESEKKIKSGWIKWRRNNRLTISYSLTC